MANFVNSRCSSLFFTIVAIYVAVLSITAASLHAQDSVLTFIEVHIDGSGGVDGLDGANFPVVSPDGKHVYVTGGAAGADNAVAVFTRDSLSGALTYIETHKDDSAGVDGIAGAFGIVLSANGDQVYVTSNTVDNAITVFNRNDTTGSLTFVETHKNGVAGVTGMWGAGEMALSSDNAYVYVSSSSSNAIAIFSRNDTTGVLTFQDSISASVAGMTNTSSLDISPDGAHMYVSSSSSHAVALFTRNDTTGAITYVETEVTNTNGVINLAQAQSVRISPDGNNVYVVGRSDNALVVFSRNKTTGSLTFVESHVDGVNSVDGLTGGYSAIVNPDGRLVFMVSLSESAVAVFSREPSSGKLTYIESHFDGVNGVDGLATGIGIVVSPDGRNVYAGGSADDAVAVFQLTSLNPSLTNTTAYFGAVPINAMRDKLVANIRNYGGQSTQVTGAASSNPNFTIVSPAVSDTVFGSNATPVTIQFAPTTPGPDSTTLTITTPDTTMYMTIYGEGGRESTEGTLTFVEAHFGGIGGVDGLAGTKGAAISPDGKHVYFTGTTDNAIAIFARDDTTGELTFSEVVVDGTNLNASYGISFSPDGANVYVMGASGHTIATYDRDADTGSLSFVNVLQDVDMGGNILGLTATQQLVMSPDGAHVYTTGSKGGGGNILIFERDALTGTLTYSAKVKDDSAGVDGLATVVSYLDISPDGKHLYVVSQGDDALSLFSRNSANGMLTYVEKMKDDSAGVDGLLDASVIAISPDGKNVYATGTSDNAMAVFSRDTSDGRLTFVEEHRDGVGQVNGFWNAWGIVVSLDGDYVYVAARADNAVTVFKRDSTTGALQYVQQLTDGVDGVDGLGDAFYIITSPDGRHMYVSGRLDNGIAAFRVNTHSVTIANDLYAGPGDTLHVPVELAGIEPAFDEIIGFEARLALPDSLLNFVGYDTIGTGAAGFLIDTSYVLVGDGVTLDTLLISAAGTTPITADGSLLDMIFIVDSNSVKGDTTTLRIEEFILNEQPAAVDMADGFFTNAQDQLYGDADHNGTVEALDVSVVLQTVVKKFTPGDSIQIERMDVSANGSIHAFDASLILQHVAGILPNFPAGSTFVGKQTVQEPAVPTLQQAMQDDGTVTVSVVLSNVTALSAADLHIEFDKNSWTYLGYTLPDALTGFQVEAAHENGLLRIAMASPVDLTFDGELVHLHFRRSANAPAGAAIRLTELYLDELQVLGPANTLATETLPITWDLGPNYPNPFNPATTVQYQIPEDAHVTISIYNLLGQEINQLVDEPMSAGYYTARWDGRNSAGVPVASGMYFLQMQANQFVRTRKMLLLQ